MLPIPSKLEKVLMLSNSASTSNPLVGLDPVGGAGLSL